MGNICNPSNMAKTCNPSSGGKPRDYRDKIDAEESGKEGVLIITPLGKNPTPVEAIQVKPLDSDINTKEQSASGGFDFKKQDDLDEYFGLFDVTFKTRPFGFGCDPAIERNYLEVSSIQKEELADCGLHIGALIVGCNEVYFEEANMDVGAIIKYISEKKLPVKLHFAIEKVVKRVSGQSDQTS